MKTKAFEVRDAATFIPVVAVKVQPANEAQAYLMRRAGYSFLRPSIIVTYLSAGGRPANYDPFGWENRTMLEAHRYIDLHFDELEDGDVIDVEFILGEKPTKKVSEQFDPDNNGGAQ